MATNTVPIVDYLARRGLTEKTIKRYSLSGTMYQNRPALRYPTMGVTGGKAERVKFTDGQKPKVKWAGEIGEQTPYRYYSAGGLSTAIKAASGTLYWLSGEPDVWTMYEVFGIEYATCTFGEGSVPDTVAADLKALGVTRVVMYPDLDTPGMKAAAKLWRLLKDADIEFVARRIPGEMESKADLNQLWQDTGFNREHFASLMDYAVAHALTDTDLELYAIDDGVSTNGTSKQATLNFDSLFHEWIETVIQALGQPDIREGRVERWHCPTTTHSDKNPSFRIAEGDRCKMPICTCGVQDLEPKEAWNAVARGCRVATWDEYKAQKRAESGIAKPAKPNTATPEPPPVVHTDDEPLWVDSHTIYKQMLDHLEGENIPDIEFIECPLTCLHEYGGFAQIMFPGKLVYMVGVSGGGKTSMGETMGEKLLRQGYDFVWYGPEWTPYEMGLRSLQRAGGADMIRMAENFHYQVQGKRGIPSDKRKGSPLSEDEITVANREILNMANWAGRAYFMTPRANKLPLTQMLDTVRALVQDRRKQGRKVVAFFFDYLQRANKRGRDGAFWSEEVIGEIKSLCEELALVGFIMVQPKKSDSEDARDNVKLSEASGQGLSDQQCNLYLAIAPMFEKDTNGDAVMTDFTKIRIVKNSMGRKGEVTVRADWSRLLLIDKKVPIHTVDLRVVNS